MIDRYRQAVYQAEDQWSAVIDRGGTVDFFGSSISAPIQLRFGRLEEVRTYVADVCSNLDVPTPTLRHRKGGTRAHYADGVIAIPSHEPWAMREAVVLHEITHHICVTRDDNVLHDDRFASLMLDLVRDRLGPEAELLLRAGYSGAGVPVKVVE